MCGDMGQLLYSKVPASVCVVLMPKRGGNKENAAYQTRLCLP